MTGAHETEFEQALRLWEQTGQLPDPGVEQGRRLRRMLLALDLERSRPSEPQIEAVLCRLPLGAPAPGTLRQAANRAHEVWEEVTAVLRLDLGGPNPAYRSGATDAPAIYETPLYTITIAVSVESVRGTVHPKLSAELPHGGRVCLAQGEDRTEVDLDSRGGFLFEELEFDEGRLEIEIGGQRIDLGALPGRSA